MRSRFHPNIINANGIDGRARTVCVVIRPAIRLELPPICLARRWDPRGGGQGVEQHRDRERQSMHPELRAEQRGQSRCDQQFDRGGLQQHAGRRPHGRYVQARLLPVAPRVWRPLPEFADRVAQDGDESGLYRRPIALSGAVRDSTTTHSTLSSGTVFRLMAPFLPRSSRMGVTGRGLPDGICDRTAIPGSSALPPRRGGHVRTCR